jgi:hypothetical protein
MKRLVHPLALVLCLLGGSPRGWAQVDVPDVHPQLPDVDVFAEPTFGSYTVESGFSPDPMVITVRAGGSVDSSPVCRAGHIARVPDVRILYTASDRPLRIFVDGQGLDTTLAINGPDALWRCNDDWLGLNPEIDFRRPTSGQYDIFVGTFYQGQYPEVTLYISELDTTGPSGTWVGGSQVPAPVVKPPIGPTSTEGTGEGWGQPWPSRFPGLVPGAVDGSGQPAGTRNDGAIEPKRGYVPAASAWSFPYGSGRNHPPDGSGSLLVRPSVRPEDKKAETSVMEEPKLLKALE